MAGVASPERVDSRCNAQPREAGDVDQVFGQNAIAVSKLKPLAEVSASVDGVPNVSVLSSWNKPCAPGGTAIGEEVERVVPGGFRDET